MGRERGVIPDRVRLALSDGDYVDVKRELNWGEVRELFARWSVAGAGDERTVNPQEVAVATLLSYLLGWSLVSIIDHQPIPYDVDDPVELRRAVLNSLDPPTANEIMTAVNAHIGLQAEAREAKKKTLPGVLAS